MAIGCSLDEVVAAATHNPARILALRDVGTLSVGAYADVALLRQHAGSFHFYDIAMQTRTGSSLLRCEQTILNGRVMKRRPDPEPMPWIQLRPYQQHIIDHGHTPDQMARHGNH
jgi:predicted amidohydrolase